MDHLRDVPKKNSTNRMEIIKSQKQIDGIKVVDRLQSIEEQRVVAGSPKVVQEGLLLPFTYIEKIHNGKPIDTLYYLLINKETLKEVAKLIKEYDDGK